MRKIGTQKPLEDGERDALMAELAWWRDRAQDFYETREAYENAFYCVWEGQNPDGTVHDGKEALAWPFDGASDRRVRWGDKICNDLKALVMIALQSCEVEFACGAGREGEARARALKALLGWELNKMGAKGWGEILAMLQYMLVDSPAVAAVDVAWRRRVTYGVETADRETMQARWTAWKTNTAGVSEAEAEFAFARALETAAGGGEEIEGGEEALADVSAWLVASEGVREGDAAEILAALAEDGACECLKRTGVDEGPELKALRYGDDFVMQRETKDFDYADPIIRGEWVKPEQLRERVAEDGWDEDWVEETIRHAGSPFYNEMSTRAVEDMRDYCNVVWFYKAETNDRGETVRYVCVLSHADGSAFGKRVIRSRRGTWNMAFFRREVVGRKLLSGRGLARLCAPDQGVAKVIADGAANNAIVGALPPVKAKGTRVRNAVVEPFAVIPMGVNDDVAFMQPPAYPAIAKEIEDRIKGEMLAYFGISDGRTDVTERRQFLVQDMLRQFQELFTLLVEVAQDGASEETLAGITGEGDVRGLKAEDVTGRFGIQLKLDPRNLDWKQLNEKMQTFSQVIMGMDRDRQVDTRPVVAHVMHQMWPEISKESLRSPEEMSGQDVEAEKQNFVMIKGGVMPRMDTEGRWNYAARLEFWQRMQQENPEAIAEMSPRAQEMAQKWIAALEQQNTQYGVNAEIGKTGVESVQGR